MQMGQETIYLLLAVTMFTTIILGGYLLAVIRAQPRQNPPIIVLPEAQGFSFAAGSAALTPGFEDRLRRLIIPRIRDTGFKYQASVIEVIGHTDAVPRRSADQRSNLDTVLVPLFLGKETAAPVAVDNAGLGMARAVSVARFMRMEGLRDFTLVPLSAGPFLRPDDSAVTADDGDADGTRRRIEIRLRRREQR
jgi:outer membrane protein OmpA-like peptidoglycan-associated protein